ncbi:MULTISPECIES: hypothetical protein [unclassified Vibrio]|uniref:hypothetical protein n=1 Tax=unclassified Vibrio TaxID=2614977 RepID=UPI0027D29F0E|nr:MULTISPECIES: hypothetical protein [unclassified Vibrio]
MSNTSPFKEYWLAYGGWSALLSSRYFWMAICLTFLMYNSWYPIESKWYQQVISVIPSVLGFTLGGFAMWVAIGDERFKSLIAGTDEDDEISPYMEVNATFTHFVLLQLLSLLLAILASSYSDVVITNLYMVIGARFYAFFAYFLFIYALLTAIAAVFAILKVAKWYDDFQTSLRKPKD